MRTLTTILLATLTFLVGSAVSAHTSLWPVLITRHYNDYQPPAPALPRYTPGAQSMLFLGMASGGTCTGVVVGRHTVLTAAHCVALGGALATVNDQPVESMILANDGHDHILVHVDRPLKGRIAHVTSLPEVGSEVYLWGNPGDLRGVMRIGYVAGKAQKIKGELFDIIDVNCGPGDSGGAYFDAAGNVVAITYGTYGLRDGSFNIGIVQPFAFQPHQLQHLA